MSNIKEVKFAPRNENALSLAEFLVQTIKGNDNATELFVLLKIGTEYHRYSTDIKDMATLISMLEIAKFDSLKRMSE